MKLYRVKITKDSGAWVIAKGPKSAMTIVKKTGRVKDPDTLQVHEEQTMARTFNMIELIAEGKPGQVALRLDGIYPIWKYTKGEKVGR